MDCSLSRHAPSLGPRVTARTRRVASADAGEAGWLVPATGYRRALADPKPTLPRTQGMSAVQQLRDEPQFALVPNGEDPHLVAPNDVSV